MSCPEFLEPVDAALEVFSRIACWCQPQTQSAVGDLGIEFRQAQLGQILFMFDDTASLSHDFKLRDDLE